MRDEFIFRRISHQIDKLNPADAFDQYMLRAYDELIRTQFFEQADSPLGRRGTHNGQLKNHDYTMLAIIKKMRNENISSIIKLAVVDAGMLVANGKIDTSWATALTYTVFGFSIWPIARDVMHLYKRQHALSLMENAQQEITQLAANHNLKELYVEETIGFCKKLRQKTKGIPLIPRQVL